MSDKKTIAQLFETVRNIIILNATVCLRDNETKY